jgi:hypothetical protein
VEVIFKSSPFGSQSHGYEAQNAFLLYAFGERLLIRSGRRDQYGSRHHRDWMWETKSVNSITVNGRGQKKHSADAEGRITAFYTSEHIDYVAGEAGESYGSALDRFTRHILFAKPDLVLVYDQLDAPEPSTFEWRLHTPTPLEVKDPMDIRVRNGKAGCRIAFLEPDGLRVTVTDEFDVPPRPRVKLKEWHLTAATPTAVKHGTFITVLQPHRIGHEPAAAPVGEPGAGEYKVSADTSKGTVHISLREGARNPVTAKWYGRDGKQFAAFPPPAARP